MGVRISGIIFIAALLSIFVYVSYSTGEVGSADESNTTSTAGSEEETTTFASGYQKASDEDTDGMVEPEAFIGNVKR